MIRNSYQRIVMMLAVAAFAALGGCGGGGGGDSGVAVRGPGSSIVTVSGASVKGPVQNPDIIIRAIGGGELQRVPAQITATFTLTLGAEDLPVILETSGGTDSVTLESPPLFPLSGLAYESGLDDELTIALTPYTTLAVLISERMPGGLSVANYQMALANLYSNQPLGLDRTKIDTVENLSGLDLGDAGAAVAEGGALVLASETLGELIRRLANEPSLGLDVAGVLEFLASDLVDGLLDGRNPSGAVNPQGALFANLFGAQLILEVLDGSFQVNGQPFGLADLSAALTVMVGDVDAMTVIPRLCEDVLTQLRIAITSAFKVLPSAALDDALRAFDAAAITLEEDECLSAAAVATILTASFPPNAGALLDGPLSQASLTDPTEANQVVTDAVREGEPFLEANASRSDVNLQWSRPTELTNGDPLANGDIVRYEVLIGFAPLAYDTVQTVPNTFGDTVNATAVDLLDLIPQYIAVRAVSTEGAEGPPSNEICVIPPNTDC